MSHTELVKNAIDDYVAKLKKHPYYRLTVNVQDASGEESEEILSEIERLSDDDLTIATVKHFEV